MVPEPRQWVATKPHQLPVRMCHWMPLLSYMTVRPTVLLWGEAIDKVCFTPGGELTQEATCAAFNIGFDFPVAGEMKTTFLVSGAGYVLFGNGDINANPSMTSWIFSYEGDYSLVGLVSQRGVASTADTRISYQLTGSGDAAELVVQYENFCVKNAFFGDGASVDYQIRFAKTAV